MEQPVTSSVHLCLASLLNWRRRHCLWYSARKVGPYWCGVDVGWLLEAPGHGQGGGICRVFVGFVFEGWEWVQFQPILHLSWHDVRAHVRGSLVRPLVLSSRERQKCRDLETFGDMSWDMWHLDPEDAPSSNHKLGIDCQLQDQNLASHTHKATFCLIPNHISIMAKLWYHLQSHLNHFRPSDAVPSALCSVVDLWLRYSEEWHVTNEVLALDSQS